VNNENDNVTNDPFLDEYFKILNGFGQPEIIDKMIYERHDQRNCSTHSGCHLGFGMAHQEQVDKGRNTGVRAAYVLVHPTP